MKILDCISLLGTICSIIFLCMDIQNSSGNALSTDLEIPLVLKRLFKGYLFYSQKRKLF